MLGFFSAFLSAQSTDKKSLGTFWICWENDTFLKTDRGFTNGLKLAWISPAAENPRRNVVFGWMPFVRKPEFLHLFSYSLRQDVFTPDDISTLELDKNDRPYAGYLTFEVGIHSLGKNRAASFTLSLGVVGPLSMAEQVQKFVHNRNVAPEPQGWHHQLQNELAIQVIYENKGRFLLFGAKKGLEFDFIPHVAGGVGNVYTYGSTGFQTRLGWNLPDDFGVPLLRPGGSSGVGMFNRNPVRFGSDFNAIYLFSAVDGQMVLRNIFLDGNSIRGSHSVEKDVLTWNLQMGFGVKIRYLNINVAYVLWSRLFELQKSRQAYMITNISYTF